MAAGTDGGECSVAGVVGGLADESATRGDGEEVSVERRQRERRAVGAAIVGDNNVSERTGDEKGLQRLRGLFDMGRFSDLSYHRSQHG